MPILLTNNGDCHTLTLNPTPAQHDEIQIDFKWSRNSSWLRQLVGRAKLDFDLGCYYELRNGKRLLIDSLQFSNGHGGPRDRVTRQGCYTQPPYIWHTGDDPGHNEHSREKIIVNPMHAGELHRLIVYAYIYDGPTKWHTSDAVLTVRVPGCEPVAIKIDGENTNHRFCTLAAINFNDDSTMTVQKILSFYYGHSDCDRAYGWGFKYYDNKRQS